MKHTSIFPVIFRGLSICLLLAGLNGCRGPYGPFDLCVKLPNTIQADVDANLVLTPQYGPVVETPLSGSRSHCRGPKIALIDVDGILVNTDLTGPYSAGENPVASFHEKLAAVERQSGVCAAVVRINSPGGSVAASQIMREELAAFRERTGLPVVACLMDLATGGAYYLATESDLIVAQTGTITGGIGVILNLYDLEDLFDVGPEQSIRAGDNIDIGSPVKELKGSDEELLQAIANEFHQQFITDVASARPLSQSQPATTVDGRIFTAGQAKSRGLVDEIGFLSDAIRLARGLAEQPNAEVFMYRRKNQPTYSMYATSPNVPLQSSLSLINLPPITRSRLPTFLYMWQPEPSMERLGGK